MRCLRIYATPDGESHFDEIDIPTTRRSIFPDAAPFELSAHYPASRIRFTRIPARIGEVGWHTVPERVLTVRLDGSAEYETSDGAVRRVPAGGFVLVEDTHGKGHVSRHSAEEQSVIWITLPNGLELPDADVR
ncbi:MAG TPA: hypothetical protein VLX09_27280 [Stellaceae bacterium]|nr:hypothetical protein [Stellaceae bacterium]